MTTAAIRLMKPDAEASAEALAQWERSFRAAARKDKSQGLRAHLRKLDIPTKPGLLLEGTILVVQACVAYLMLDNQRVVEFLEQQQYGCEHVPETPYLVTFDLHGKAFARISTSIAFRNLDFADLYGMPWEQYKSVGYHQVYISRADGEDLTAKEVQALDDEVTKDLRFDYEEDELSFWFDPDTLEGVLIVVVQNVDPEGATV